MSAFLTNSSSVALMSVPSSRSRIISSTSPSSAAVLSPSLCFYGGTKITLHVVFVWGHWCVASFNVVYPPPCSLFTPITCHKSDKQILHYLLGRRHRIKKRGRAVSREHNGLRHEFLSTIIGITRDHLQRCQPPIIKMVNLVIYLAQRG